MDNRELVLYAAGILDQKKAEDIVIFDVSERSGFTDYLVIATAASLRQMEALTDEVEDKMAEEGMFAHHIEGKGESGWVLADFGDIIVNIFTPQQREHYQLERIWKDCVQLDFEQTE